MNRYKSRYIRHHFRGCIRIPVESRRANSCRACCFITLLVTLSGCSQIRRPGVSVGRLTSELRPQVSLSVDLVLVVAAALELLLFGVCCGVFRTAASLFLLRIFLLRPSRVLPGTLSHSLFTCVFTVLALRAPFLGHL